MRSMGLLICSMVVLVGCAGGPITDARHVLLTPEQVASIAAEIGIEPCEPGERAAVTGADVRGDGSVDLAVACIQP